jgi:hypothetical protein
MLTTLTDMHVVCCLVVLLPCLQAIWFHPPGVEPAGK